MNQSNYTLINPQTGDLAFRYGIVEDANSFEEIQRNPFFSLIWVKKGKGKVMADFASYEFGENTLFAFAPYQPFSIQSDEALSGLVINFHSEFFCIYKHHKEVSCNGVLYNNIYSPPFVTVDSGTEQTLDMISLQIKTEIQNTDLAQYELLVSYLKIFLITAARLKMQQQELVPNDTATVKEPFLLQKLKDAIEEHFRSKHSPSEYAELLYISPKALAKITKTHFHKTLSAVINERIIIEAKRELYLTNKTVKEIAHELGYEDEYYFSRFFKVNAMVSPQTYRDTVGFAKAV